MVKVVNVDLINDTAAEAREYFDLRLSSPVGATLLPQPTGRAFIGANDQTAQSLPLLSVSDAVADESNTWLEFVVSLNAPSTQKVSVAYNNSNVTAPNGSDYLAQSSTLTFAPGETTKVVKIPVLNTAGIESTEVLGLNLFNAVNATIARPLAYGTIFDNDQTSGTPVIRVADQVVDEASGQVAFIVALDKPSTGNVSVNVATANGSALSGSDYQALPTQTLTFTPGEMVKVVTVGLTNDTSSEPGEYFDLRLSSPVGASLPDTNARAFIAPSDATAASLPRIGVSDATADEIEHLPRVRRQPERALDADGARGLQQQQHHGHQRQRLPGAVERHHLRARRDDEDRQDPGAGRPRHRADRAARAEPVQCGERDDRAALRARHHHRQRRDERHAEPRRERRHRR